MINEIAINLTDEFVVFVDEPITEHQRNIFNQLYTPITGNTAAVVYPFMYSLVKWGSNSSSNIKHQQFLKKVNLSLESFQEARNVLEALGLLEVYRKLISKEKYLYVYVLKSVKSPQLFFQDSLLLGLLENRIGVDETEALACEFVLTKYDLNQFENITKSLDEVFDRSKTKTDFSDWTRDSKHQEELKGKHLDYPLYLALCEARDLIPKEEINNKDLFRIVNRIAWLFSLTAEELKDASIDCFTEKPFKIDEKKLRRNARLIYEVKYMDKEGVEPIIKTVQRPSTEQAQALENITPSQLVYTMYGTKLLGSEVEMFDRLLQQTKVSVGVLNVAIIYVLKIRNGQIPTLNYFLKIINTWLRGGIKSTDEALNYINSPDSGHQKKTPTWQANYEKELEKKNDDDSEKSMSMDELEKYFKGENK